MFVTIVTLRQYSVRYDLTIIAFDTNYTYFLYTGVDCIIYSHLMRIFFTLELVTSPADLRIIYFPSNNSISILYSPLNVTQEFGDILGYKIILYVADSPYNSTVYTQGANETSRTVPLIPGQHYYYIRVLGFTLAGDGPVSEAYFSQPGYTTGTYPEV